MNVSVLGLGIIGSAWARNLIADGHAVRCWNRTPKDFPFFYPSIHEAVDSAGMIFIVVADPAAVESVIGAVKPHLRPGQVVVQSSTISARWTRQFAAAVETTGAHYLEAPFTGSKPAAEQRKTVFYLGGEMTVIEMARPVLESLSSAVLHIGTLGTASTLKLAMNLNVAAVSQALAESLSFCRNAGISDDIFFSALERNVGRSGLCDLKESKLRAHDYSPQFSVKHMAKDLRLALETADDVSVPLFQTEHLKNLYDRAMANGWGDDDFIGLIRLLNAEAKEK